MAKKTSDTENETSSSQEPKVVSRTPKRQHNLKFQAAQEKDYEVIQWDDPQLIQKIENQYPEMTGEFKRIIFTQYELFAKKMESYGADNISLGTKLDREEDIDMSLKGLWFRMNDKMQRFKNMLFNNAQDKVGEPLEDTWQDLSIYSIITQLVKNGKWGK